MLEIRILADPDEDDGSGRTVEVRLIARPRPDEDPLEDSRLFAAGDPERIVAFVAELLERHAAALPAPRMEWCRRCDRALDPAAEGDRRRPFVCLGCQRAAVRGSRPAGPKSAREGLEVRFLGTGDAFGAGGKRQAAIFVRALGSRLGLLLDAGPGCHAALRAEGLTSDDLGAVLLSHFHGDHYGGFPFLELDAMRSGRTDPLQVIAPPGAPERLATLRECLYRGLPLRFEEEIAEALPGETIGLPAAVGGGSARALAARHQPGAWAFSWRLDLGGRTVVYSGDTGFSDELISESAAADLLIHECTSLEALPGHTSHRELEEAASRITARRVLLVHTGEDVLGAAGLAFERAHDGLRVVV
ncbi:MAG: MBL fold metallo-hydrolase [Acidobacteriota bacterium]|nr:MBL fold metallo-hydrolase [Acidobacteriota bacterium]